VKSAASWLVAGAFFAAASVFLGTLVRRRRRAMRAIDTGSVSTRWLTQANWERDE
jgi:hypothetical protein